MARTTEIVTAVLMSALFTEDDNGLDFTFKFASGITVVLCTLGVIAFTHKSNRISPAPSDPSYSNLIGAYEEIGGQ